MQEQKLSKKELGVELDYLIQWGLNLVKGKKSDEGVDDEND